ncbi:MAG: class I SAM-dependent methyltransferase [Cyclobacteriaceae bacterium]|jgi:predicted O-methyltransferase YrrM|nr:class I SAM-dependent methyltransferase [Flammeovirgaceae bacterium]MCZ8022363.1 class I SAM-dependent methyltransferase [Cytophagales bacterium]MCZ8327447.1 class I SAM-dependent methyltransferase [Cyclobacteriaceae bacterium]
MKQALFRLKAYLTYWLTCVDAHSLHSPFFFDFYQQVVAAKSKTIPAQAEHLRKQLQASSQQITFFDLGTYKNSNPRTTTLKKIAATSLSTSAFSKLYQRAIQHFKAKEVIELGTCFGINTLYLAHNPETHVTTFEGVPEIATIARDTFQFSGNTNITLIEGDINNTLPTHINACKTIDFAFVDANHRLEPCLAYFEFLLKKSTQQTVFVFDDIHHSAQMELAWQKIKEHPLVYGTADLYRCGFVFLDQSLNRQHWRLTV